MKIDKWTRGHARRKSNVQTAIKRHCEIVFKDGAGYDSGNLIQSVQGLVGTR